MTVRSVVGWMAAGYLLLPGSATPGRAAPAAKAEPDGKARETIKSQRYEIQAVPYRDDGRDDPFVAKVPLKAVQSRDRWKVRIGGLRLSSVMSGKRRVALFTETFGPRYSYILVNRVLIGPDHRPIPGIAGYIEPIGAGGNFRVTLQQGAERVNYTFIRQDEEDRRRAAQVQQRKTLERDRGAGSRVGTPEPERSPARGGDQ